MRHKLLIALLLIGAGLVAQLQAWPQSSTSPKEPAAPAEPTTAWTSPPPLKLATVVGERLDYLVSWADYLVAARVQLEVKEPPAASQPDGWPLQMQVQTVGVVRSLFVAIDDLFISYVDPQSLLPARFEKHLRQGTRRTDTTITFDHKALTAQVGEKSVPIELETRDVVALFYHIRTLDLSSGKQHKLVGMFDEKPFTVLVSSEQKAVIETANGPVEAIEVALRSEEGQGRRAKINDEYRVRVWFSNDEKRTPVLITARPPFGEIRVRLTKPEG
jgi:hypothetical protein